MIKSEIKITNITDEEIRAVANIHAESISLGFLSQLGPKFLFYLYKSIYECPQTELVIAKKNNLTLGFITGCSSLRPVLKHLLKNYFFAASISIIPKLANVSTIKRIFEIITYSTKDTDKLNLPPVELLSLAVTEPYRGYGVAENLYEKLQYQFKLSGLTEFKIIVGEDLLQAQKFYERMGATKVDTIDLHKNSTSFIYKASTG